MELKEVDGRLRLTSCRLLSGETDRGTPGLHMGQVGDRSFLNTGEYTPSVPEYLHSQIFNSHQRLQGLTGAVHRPHVEVYFDPRKILRARSFQRWSHLIESLHVRIVYMGTKAI